MTDIASLTARFALPGILGFREAPGGFVIADIDNGLASLSLTLQGAQVLTWTPCSQQPVVWLSPAAKFVSGKSLRGGVPICWPWFGPHATHVDYPAHGYVRTAPWQLLETRSLEDGRTELLFGLQDASTGREYLAQPPAVEYRIIVGAALSLELTTRNTGDAPVTITEALHTYFTVSDISAVSVSGLDGSDYLDKVDGGKRKRQGGDIRVDGEVDRVYLNTQADCLIEDPRWHRRIRIAKQGSNSTVVWNPWIEKANKLGDLGDNGYRQMLCVESGNAADDAVTVAPGQTHRLAVVYSVETQGK